ncbi:MAG: hypothetical protein K2G03_05505 [Bacilli bacterium]|nr:hypothetical protein [Bacilli bacterium]MDE6142040.1 hypothetical protein [Bacilli bacterium]
MKNLLETNIYDVKGDLLICGTCLPSMQRVGYEELAKNFDTILSLCLEKDHVNMAVMKICGMISTKKVTSITFASVNKSPHCTQLHYIRNEIVRVMNGEMLPLINNVIIQDNHIYNIDESILSLSKDLVKLSTSVSK